MTTFAASCAHSPRRACTHCHTQAVLASWAIGGGLDEEATDLVECLIERPNEAGASLSRFGSAAGRDGWSMEDVRAWIAQLAVLADTHAAPLGSFAAGVALGQGWADAATTGGGEHQPAIDPATGLATAEVLAQALATFHDRCESVGINPLTDGSVVLADADLALGQAGIASLVTSARLAAIGASARQAFVKGELVCALAPGRIAALVTRPEDLDGAADRLRVYLRRNPALVRVPSVVWSEAVPPRSRVRRFVDDLTAATLG